MSASASTVNRAASLPRLRLRGAAQWLGPPWVWAILGLVLIYGFFVIPDFWRWDNLSSVMRQAIPLALVAMGQTLVILTGGIDISVAVVLSLSNTMAMGLMNGSEDAVIYALILPVLAGAAIGLVNGVIVTRVRVPAFIMTLGTASVVQGIVFSYTNYDTYGRPAESVSNIGFATWGPLPALVWLFIPVLLLALVIQNRTRPARHLYAVGGDEESARLAGVRIDRIKIGAYVACSSLAALAGIVLTTRTGGGEPLAGVGYDWDSIAAVVIGGTALRGGKGGIAGTIVAVLLLATVDNAMNLSDVSSFWQSLVKGTIVMVAVVTAAVVALRPLEVWRTRRAGATAPERPA